MQVAEAVRLHQKVTRSARGAEPSSCSISWPSQACCRGQALPAPVVGWHAPAVMVAMAVANQPDVIVGRRTDHSPRCHGPGSAARVACHGTSRDRRRHDPHHPRSRSRGRRGRPGDGDVRRPCGRARLYHRCVRASDDAVHTRSPRVNPAARRCRHPSATDSGRATIDDRPEQGLRVLLRVATMPTSRALCGPHLWRSPSSIS